MAQLVGFDPSLPTTKKAQFNAIDFNMLSKKALREIIGILIQEVERLSRPNSPVDQHRFIAVNGHERLYGWEYQK